MHQPHSSSGIPSAFLACAPNAAKAPNWVHQSQRQYRLAISRGIQACVFGSCLKSRATYTTCRPTLASRSPLPVGNSWALQTIPGGWWSKVGWYQLVPWEYLCNKCEISGNPYQPTSRVGFPGLGEIPRNELSTLLSAACFLANFPDMTSLPESIQLLISCLVLCHMVENWVMQMRATSFGRSDRWEPRPRQKG